MCVSRMVKCEAYRSVTHRAPHKYVCIELLIIKFDLLQSELDTLTATLKQLENQRGEAQKRLDDLQAQVVIVA